VHNRVFLPALRLHKAYIGENRDTFTSNLSAAIGLAHPQRTSCCAITPRVADAERTLFFVVPLLSTTFASFSKQFRHLSQEALGWLLIDEAGQATPQMDVGARLR
jgi:hypothetical protein